MESRHLAQVNVARARGPLDSAVMAEFVGALDRVNAAAESSPGFVWRLKDDAGNATSIRAYEDPRMVFNLSVWTSVPALKAYVYRSLHGEFLARRRAWFEELDTPATALWWLDAGTLPSVADAVDRLAHLALHGESPRAFTFRRLYCADGKPA